MLARLTPDLRSHTCRYLPLVAQATLHVRGAPNVVWRRKWFVWPTFWNIDTLEPRQPFVFDTARECAWALAFLVWAKNYMTQSFAVQNVTDRAVQMTASVMTKHGKVLDVCVVAWPELRGHQLWHGPDADWWIIREEPAELRLEKPRQRCVGEPFRNHLNEYREHFLRYYLEVVGVPVPRGTADAWHDAHPHLLDIVRCNER